MQNESEKAKENERWGMRASKINLHAGLEKVSFVLNEGFFNPK